MLGFFKNMKTKKAKNADLEVVLPKKPEHAAHEAVALQAAQEGIVLLKNTGILPLKEGTVLNLFGVAMHQFRIDASGAGKTNPRYVVDLLKAVEKNEAFAYLAAVMVRKTGEAKRISSKPQEPENEKYYFRIWLVQLGMDGADCKAHRQALLAGLKGHSAFRTDADAAKFSANQKAKRKARKAEQGGGEDA